MDFYKDQKPKQGEGQPKLAEYKPATPIVPVNAKPPTPVDARTYATANQPRKIGPRIEEPEDDYEDSGSPVLRNILRLLTWPFRLGCRGCGCLLLLLMIGFVVFAAYLFTTKPAFLWNPIVNIANGNVQTELDQLKSQPSLSFQEATTQLSAQTESFNIGANQLIVNRAQLQAIMDRAFQQFVPTEIYAQINDDEIKLLWNVDQTIGQGLWMVVKLGIDSQNRLHVTHIGFNSISLPGFINKILTDAALAGLRLQSGRDINEILDTILNLPDSVTINKVDIEPGQLIITVELKSGLDNLFN